MRLKKRMARCRVRSMNLGRISVLLASLYTINKLDKHRN